MVAIPRQAARSNFKNFGISFYLWGMSYARANNASNEFSMYSRAAHNHWASQYLCQVLVDTNVLNQSITAPTQHLVSMYNFAVVSLTRKNSSTHPAPCFALSKQTKRYTVTVVPNVKNDAKFVHQLSIAEWNLKVWNYGIMRSSSSTELLLYTIMCNVSLWSGKYEHTSSTASALESVRYGKH